MELKSANLNSLMSFVQRPDLIEFKAGKESFLKNNLYFYPN